MGVQFAKVTTSAVRTALTRVVALGALATLACTPDAEPAVLEAVSTNLTAYTVGDNVIVSWDSMSGSTTDWMAIGSPSDPCSSYTYWAYTGGGTSGSMTFTGVGIGTWDARAYNDWAGTGSSACAFRSATFTVSAAGATVTTDDTSYVLDENVVVSWSGLPTNPLDWVAIAAQGSPLSSYVAWSYTGGNAAGSWTHTPRLAPGTYVARAFLDNGSTLLDESPPFTVLTPAVSTNHASYTPSESMIVSWTNMPTLGGEWVSIANAGSAPGSLIAWSYTTTTNGSHTFTAPSAVGNYVARIFDNASVLLAEVPFTVAPATITTNASTYGADVDIVLSWTNLPGNANDYTVFAEAGAPLSTYWEWAYTGGARNGSRTITRFVPPGSYVVRAFIDNTLTLAAESAVFTVTGPPTTLTVSPRIAVGANVVVGYSAMAGYPDDWIALADAGAPPSSYGAWQYTSGSVSGSVTFAPQAVGSYEARAFFRNGGPVRASTPFEVVTPLASLSGFARSAAYDITSGGAFIAGYGRTTATGLRSAARFAPNGGAATALGDLTGGVDDDIAYAISDDGTIAAGFATSASGVEAFRWTSAGMVALSDLSGGPFYSVANGISGDGLVIVGRGSTEPGIEAFRWTSAGMTSLGDLSGGEVLSEAIACDQTGATVVGYATNAAGTVAFRWTAAGGLMSLGDLPLGATNAVAYAVSDDGSIVVGRGRTATGNEAFRWTSAGMVSLGDLAGGAMDSAAYGISGDGTVVVGRGTNATGVEAVVWIAGAPVTVRSLLTAAGVDTTGWVFDAAWAVTDDGMTIVGTGRNPAGDETGWIVERLS